MLPNAMVPKYSASVATPNAPKLDAPRLARGYTRAIDYLFDSDEDAPMPPLPIATIPAKSFPPGCISPPPQMRVTFDAAPTPKAVASATRRESVLPKPPPPRGPCLASSERNRLRAYAARTDSVDVQAVVSAKPPPPRNPKRGGWSNRRAAETPTHRNQGSQQARAANESAPSGCSKRVYEGHSSRSRNICPPTHIDRVRLCPRWCSMAKCRNIRESEATMADVGERCCGSPTASCHGGRQALATCREGGQADNSHDSMRAQGRHVQVPVRQIHVVSRRRVIVAALGSVFAW